MGLWSDFFAKKNSELSTGSSLRCGRCAGLLPDEFQTYCHSCGAPFLRVPPTTEFSLLGEHEFKKEQFFIKLKVFSIAFSFVFLFWGFSFFLSALNQQLAIDRLVLVRPLEVYTYNLSEYPALTPHETSQAIHIGIQSFEDHFAIRFNEWNVKEGVVPEELKSEYYSWKGDAQSEWPMLGLKVWKDNFYPMFSQKWNKNPGQALRVLMTNHPLYASNAAHDIETRHLGADKLISGLGHPGFVLISSYRAFQPSSRVEGAERVRFIGEYVLAHELGHAVLGLKDYVVDAHSKAGRAPASAAIQRQCLMHTDANGGMEAWQALKKRTLSQNVDCYEYERLISAFKLRTMAVLMLKTGSRVEAKRLHEQAIAQAASFAEPWLVAQWKEEHRLFLSVIRRWMTL